MMTRRRRTWLINGTLVAVVVLAAGGAGYFLFGNKLQLTSSDSTGGLRTTTVRTGDVTQTVSANGTIASQSTAAANFGVSGTVATLKVGVGTKVTQGEILATLDTTTFQAAVDEAQAAVTAAQASVDAANATTTTTTSGSGNGGNNGGSGSSATSAAQKQSQVASANSQLAQAQSTLTTAEKNLSETTLTAPIAGTVMAVSGAVGDTVSGSGNSTGTGNSTGNTGSTGNNTGNGNGNTGNGNNNSSSSSSSSSSGFISIYDMAHLKIDASFAEADAGKLQVGQDSSVTINALPNAGVTATVASVDQLPTSSGSVVEYGATLTLSAAPDGVRIGQSASVAVTVAQASNVLEVSPTAVTTAGGQSTVTVLRNGKQVRTVVQLGIKGDSAYQVTSGVTQGETLVLPSVTTSSSGNGFPNGSFPGAGNGGFGRRGTGNGGTGVTGNGLTGGGR